MRGPTTQHAMTALGLSAAMAVAGCGVVGPQAPAGGSDTAPLPDAIGSAQVQIVNDATALESRVTRHARRLTVAPRSSTEASVTDKVQSEVDLGVRLTLVAEVAPPSVDGRVVQANDVEIYGNKAVVAFNYAGDVFAGAVQVIDFANARRPVLESEVLYSQADVNAVATEGSHVFVGGAAEDAALATPALVEALEFSPGGGLVRTGIWRALPSWAVTDLAILGQELIASVGARDGGLVSMHQQDLAIAAFAPATDVRAVALGGQGLVTVCGAPGRMREYLAEGLGLVRSTEIPGYSQEFAKGTIEWASQRCYLGSGDAGMQVRADDGGMLAQLANVEFTNRVTTGTVNAVTLSNHLAFVAAGEAGVQVVRLGRYRCDGLEAQETEGLRVLGELELEPGASCNMARSRNHILVVAGGSGGVKLIAMDFLH